MIAHGFNQIQQSLTLNSDTLCIFCISETCNNFFNQSDEIIHAFYSIVTIKCGETWKDFCVIVNKQLQKLQLNPNLVTGQLCIYGYFHILEADYYF